jgi:hypothetical protein
VLGLADLLYVDGRQWESAEAYLAAARINPRTGTLPKALGEVWFLLRTPREGWQRNPRPTDAPQVERIDELLAASSPRIEAAVREILVALVEVRTEVDDVLEQALNILRTLAISVGAPHVHVRRRLNANGVSAKARQPQAIPVERDTIETYSHAALLRAAGEPVGAASGPITLGPVSAILAGTTAVPDL